MTQFACTDVQGWISERLDGETEDLDDRARTAHLAGCAECQSFATTTRSMRQALRLEPVGAVPDVTAAVHARLDPVPARRCARSSVVAALAAVAGLVVGVLISTELVAPGGRIPPAVADVVARIPRAQLEVESLVARIRVTEHGWQSDAPRRTFVGDITFRSPEHLALRLRDTTAHPDRTWVPGDVEAVLRPGVWWTSAPRPCPPPATPSCARTPAERVAVIGTEPFDPTVPAPLDLVVPAAGFRRASEPARLADRTIAGRRAAGVVTTAGQVQALLDGLRGGGNLRRFFPADRVELWLDEQALIPLAVRVVAADDADRTVWAATHGAVERPGDEILTYEVDDLEVNGPVGDERFPVPPADAVVHAAGFEPGPVAGPVAPPAGMAPGRSGTAGDGSIEVRTWSSGRGWVKVRTERAPARRVSAAPVRPVALADGSPAFVDDAAGTVTVHGDGVDVVVSGSLPEPDLVAVAGSMGIVGRPFDDPSTVATPADARRALPGVVLPRGLDRAGVVALRVDGTVVTAAVTGAGGGGFTVTAAAGNRLGPPLDMAVAAVEVRETTGRYSATRVELEWTEGGVVYSVRSSSLSRAELLAVADDLSPP